jgi:hypothetical protein
VSYHGVKMSSEEFSKGIEIIEGAARRFQLTLGSRYVDFSRGSVRLSLERSIELGGRSCLRAPVVELSREFVRDLPSEKRYKEGLDRFLHSLSLRVLHPKPLEFLTLTGVPFEAEIRWPFRPVQDSADFFVHALVKIGSPWSHEANLTIRVFSPDWILVGPSLSPPMVELFVINSIRDEIDSRGVRLHPVGEHPPELQPIRIQPSKGGRRTPDDNEIRLFIKRKIYWLGFREGDEKTIVSISDPYDCAYLSRTQQGLNQIARVLSAKNAIGLDSSSHYGSSSDGLLLECQGYESDLAEFLKGSQEGSSHDDSVETPGSARSVFISYNSDDAPFAASLASALRNRNIRTWIDQKEIRVGDSLIGKIGRALHDNDFIVVVLSPSSIGSDWVKLELKEALQREIKERRVVVLPVIARRCEIPPFLTDKKYADFTRDSGVALDALVRAIQQQRPSVHA